MAQGSTVVKVLVGCVVVVVLLCGGGVALVALVFPNALNWVKAEISKAQEWEAFAQNWKAPPADANADRLLPMKIADFQRQAVDRAAAPEVGIQQAVDHATYQSGQETVEVFALRATKADYQAAFQAATQALQGVSSQSNFRVETQSNARLTYTKGREKGILYWSQGWLFLVRTNGQTDLETFLRSYLEAIADTGNGPDQPPGPK